MNKHTPGPWVINANGDITSPHGAICWLPSGIANKQANATLLAAAPAMYMELKESLVLLRASYHDMCEKHGADSMHAQVIFERIESVGATLAQAEGRQA